MARSYARELQDHCSVDPCRPKLNQPLSFFADGMWFDAGLSSTSMLAIQTDEPHYWLRSRAKVWDKFATRGHTFNVPFELVHEAVKTVAEREPKPVKHAGEGDMRPLAIVRPLVVLRPEAAAWSVIEVDARLLLRVLEVMQMPSDGRVAMSYQGIRHSEMGRVAAGDGLQVVAKTKDDRRLIIGVIAPLKPSCAIPDGVVGQTDTLWLPAVHAMPVPLCELTPPATNDDAYLDLLGRAARLGVPTESPKSDPTESPKPESDPTS